MLKTVKQSVMRNLTKSMAAISILAPASVYALGVGDIKLHSTLNQNLHAEIALFVSSGENISEINVRLAAPDKFDEVGIPWSYFLSKIKFESVTKADGSIIIKLTSNEILREPFLDFLLEVSWAKGHLYREYTVLVDPQAAYAQPIFAVVDKATLETMPTEAVADNGRPITHYGPTRTDDTLWAIAKETNTYSEISIEQMLMAIYEANPRAFYKDNVNALMAGETLDIPEKEVVLRLSSKEALTAFKQQVNVWKGAVAMVTQNKPLTPTKSKMITQLELEAPAEEEVAEEVVIMGSELLSESVDKSPVEKPEPLTAVGLSNESLALLVRLEKLEKDLFMMQKMLAVKDEKIAALQSQQHITRPTKITGDEEKVKKPMLEAGVLSGLVMPVLSGITFIVLGALGWLWSRNKQAKSDVESMFATASETSSPDSIDDSSISIMEANTSYDVATVGESSFLSEFTPSNFDADQQEVDPVSEADVYLAYGRYQQAEDLVRQAIIDQPDSDECKLKLLEIFHANENKAAFEEFATELVNAGRHNDLEFWSKVVVMGGEIAPDSSLFTDQGDIKTDLNAEELREDKGVVSDFVFDLSVFDTENAVEAEIAEGLESELDISSNSAETFSHANAAEAFDMSVSDLTDMDELETKIDLAKAYVEMGDEEAAREIADEVIAKGTERQKAIAQAIIDQLK